jgi:hypothetical protein
MVGNSTVQVCPAKAGFNNDATGAQLIFTAGNTNNKALQLQGFIVNKCFNLN